jgi:SNF family Na+-dependent transporter
MNKKRLLFCVGGLLVVFGVFFKLTNREMLSDVEILSDVILPAGLLMEVGALVWLGKEKLTERKKNKA